MHLARLLADMVRLPHHRAMCALLTLATSAVGCSAGDVDLTSEDDAVDEPSRDGGRDGSTRDGGSRDAGARDDDDDDDDDDDGDDDAPGPRTDDRLDGEQCDAIRRDAPPAKGGVDVVFLVDTSGSMLHALAQVTQNLAKFVMEFDDTSVDTRVVMITQNNPAANSPLAGQRDKYLFISSEVDSKQLYSVAQMRFDQYKDFLRSNASTQFVMITDDNDRVAAGQFKMQMEQLLGRPFVQHAIASEDVMGAPCTSEIAFMTNPLCQAIIPGLGGIPALCTAAAIGRTYYQLADDTGGEKLSICKGDWTDVFARLKAAVIEAAPLPCDYPLADVDDFDPEKVSVVYEADNKKEQAFPKAATRDSCADKLGWHYDDEDAPSNIVLCPAACESVRKGGSIDIALGCPPQVFL